jgi:hypothetical protein
MDSPASDGETEEVFETPERFRRKRWPSPVAEDGEFTNVNPLKIELSTFNF